MNNLKAVLMSRDGLSAEQADERIDELREKLKECLAEGSHPFDFMQDECGLEPDYLYDLGL